MAFGVSLKREPLVAHSNAILLGGRGLDWRSKDSSSKMDSDPLSLLRVILLVYSSFALFDLMLLG